MNKIRLTILTIGLWAGLLGSSFASTNTVVKALSFATDATYPPFETVLPSGALQGFDIDVANAICATLKVKCVFMNQPFDGLIPNLNIGKFDAIIAAMNITQDRAKAVDFSKAYYKNTASIVANNATNFTITPQGMKDKTIGVQQGTTLLQYLKKTYGSNVKVKTYANAQTAFIDLTSGRVDAVMGDTPIMQQWLKEHGKGRYHFVGKPISDTTYFGSGYGIAVKKGNKATLNSINRALETLQKNGKLSQIEAKYFPR
ncbi:MAG: transporter substrate-binding domain-containing protein [Neisseriaceae bacterium]